MKLLVIAALVAGSAQPLFAAGVPVRARHGMVVSQEAMASRAGTKILESGGNAIDAAIATAFVLAVTHPSGGNLGGGGFLLYRPATGEPVAYDFREMAPAAATPTMFLRDGHYDEALHHDSVLSIGVPGTVAGLHQAWREHGKLPWKALLAPAIALARDGFTLSDPLARSLLDVLPAMKPYPASVAQFSKAGVPYQAGELLRQSDLARTLTRIAEDGPRGFYSGETATLLVNEMRARGGLITRADLAAYAVRKRAPLQGSYRGYEVLGMPPTSSGGTALITMLNVLEGYDLKRRGLGSAAAIHVIAEAMRRAFAERARFLGDPEANPDMPLARLISKPHAAELRRGIQELKASVSTPTSFEWPGESDETTHFSVVDAARNAVALTYTLEDSYGSKLVVPGAGFLLNNEMGDFNAGPGLTDTEGLIGTAPNLAAPGKRMLSSMTPTILARDGRVFLVLGSPGGRKIINVVLLTILNVIDFGLNVQEAVAAPRFHHQWLPDRILYEQGGISPDSVALLQQRGHTMFPGWPPSSPTTVAAILYNAEEDLLEGGSDPRAAEGAAAGVHRGVGAEPPISSRHTSNVPLFHQPARY